MTYMYHDDREETAVDGFEKLLEELNAGDCMVVQRFSGAAKSAKGFTALMTELEERGIRFRSVEEGFDTGTVQGRYAVNILRKVASLDGEYRREKQREGINNAKEEGKYKGRKPIEVDEDTFDSILERWRNGEITARQAMNELNLKPNTFYRRVKERMADPKSSEAIWDAAKQLGKEIVAGVQAETEEFTQAAGKYASEVDTASVMESIGKGISAFGRTVGSLSKDFQDALNNYDTPKKPTSPTEEPAEAPAPESFTEDSEEDASGKEWL